MQMKSSNTVTRISPGNLSVRGYQSSPVETGLQATLLKRSRQSGIEIPEYGRWMNSEFGMMIFAGEAIHIIIKGNSWFPYTGFCRSLCIGQIQSQVIDQGQRGLGLKHWREWIADYFLGDPQVEEGDLLFADHLAQHFDETSVDKLQMKGIELRHFPVGSAAELSQCDNSLIKDFRVDLGHISVISYCWVLDQVWIWCPSRSTT